MIPPLRTLVLDVDGVLTDGRLLFTEDGRSGRAFHVHDGLAIEWFQRLIGPVVLLSSKDSPAVSARATELRIARVMQGSRDKLADLSAALPEMGLGWDATAAMGDDLPDLPVLRRCGYALAPANAVGEVRSAAHYVTAAAGGHGAVREAIEHLLRGMGRWQEVVRHYGAPDAS